MCLWEASDLSAGHTREMAPRSVQRLDAGGGGGPDSKVVPFIGKQGLRLREAISGKIVVTGWQDSGATACPYKPSSLFPPITWMQ